MKFLRAHISTIFCTAMLCLALGGCADMDLSAFKWPGSGFKRIDGGVATLAAPDMPESASRIHCAVGKGSARFERGWYEFAETRFILRDAERINVALARKKGSGGMVFQGVLDVAGQKMIFCPVREGPPDQRIICASLYVLEDDLQAGIKRTFDIPDAIRGSTITCAYTPEKLLKL